VHAGQIRKSGEPYLIHPLEVAYILAQLKLDEASICTGLLHDTVEDTLATVDEIKQLFGPEIAHLVDGVTKLSQVSFQSNEEKQAENFRKMLVAMSQDIRVLLVKLSDRLHNMRTLQFMKPEKQEVIALETIEIYAPLANRLGIGWMKIELEDLSFKYLRPEDFLELKERIGQTRKEREKFIDDVSSDLTKALTQAGMKHFEVSGRPKHLWSIYRKMVDKGLAFEDIHDLIAFRIMVDTIGQCYEALGHIHALWRPIPGRFKDYIAMPKPNGYRSLHTTLFGPKGERIEVQIRTRDMHEIAESGIAAHWKYKQAGGVSAPVEFAKEAGFLWLRQLMDWQRTLKDPNEFLDSVKVDLFVEEVYVFTPKGDVIELPRGATAIDFAFAIHSDVGMKCVGAKVNNRMVPLRYALENGDTCEVLTQQGQMPKKDWLDFATTSKARTKIRAFFRQAERDKSQEIGKELLEKEFKRYGTTLQRAVKNKWVDDYFEEQRYKTIEEIFIAIGYGKLDVKVTVESILPAEFKTQEHPVEEKRSKLIELLDRVTRKSSSGIRLEGVDDVLVHYARCCSPVKGDPVIGFVTRGRGLTVHRQNCQKVLELDEERRIAVQWDSNITTTRSISIRVVTDDREGMLADLSNVFSKMSMNISEAKCKGLGNGLAVNLFSCGVVDLNQLKRVVKALESVKGVHSVERARTMEDF